MLHRLTGGGFGLRLEAGLIGHPADFSCEISFGFVWFWSKAFFLSQLLQAR